MAPSVQKANQEKIGNIAALSGLRNRLTVISYGTKGSHRWHFNDGKAAVEMVAGMVKIDRRKNRPFNYHITDNGLRMTVLRITNHDE